MAHTFATLLIPAHAAAPAMPDRVCLAFAAVDPNGANRGVIQVSDNGTVHVIPADGGKPLRVSLVDIANACLKASFLRPEGVA